MNNSPKQTLLPPFSRNTYEQQIPSEFYLSLTTLPLLLGVLGLQSFSAVLTEIGKASEEVFRGDRLPVLHFPSTPPAETE